MADAVAGTVSGRADPAFRDVADLFAETVASRQERGGICIRIGGRTVMDLHGGWADPTKRSPWRPDTLACCFSVTKGVFALLLHRLAELGHLDLEAPVASLWPGFASEDKAEITVFDVLTHRAGLPAVSGDVAPGALYHPDDMARLLAASAPVVPPRAAPVYHNMTYGALVAEIVRRATGRDAQDWIAQEIAGRTGADFRIGLDTADQARAARISQDEPEALFEALRDAPETLFARSMQFFDPKEDFNSTRWRSAVIGSGSGHATASGIARIYEAFIRDGLLSPARRRALREETCRTRGDDPILGLPLRFGAGVELSTPPGIDFGPNPATIGYWGAGGATGFADPDADLAFGYVTGHMEAEMGSSPRARALIRELYACL